MNTNLLYLKLSCILEDLFYFIISGYKVITFNGRHVFNVSSYP